MATIRVQQIGQRVDTALLSRIFFGNQFPVSTPAYEYYEEIEKFVKDEAMVNRILVPTTNEQVKYEPGVYEVGFEKKQLGFIQSLMQTFELEEFSKMKPAQIFIQKTGLGRADSFEKTYGICPSNCVRFVLNYRSPDTSGQVGFAVRMGVDDSKLTPPGIIYTKDSFATVLQRNYSALTISSGKSLMGSRNRESAVSYFVIADLYAPAMLIMKIVNTTAGVKPVDFNKVMDKPGVKKIVDGIIGSVDSGKLDMESATEMIKKIVSQKSKEDEVVSVDVESM